MQNTKMFWNNIFGTNITVYKHRIQYTHTILVKDYKKYTFFYLIKRGSEDISNDTYDFYFK